VKDAILYAGDLLVSPYRLAERFSAFVGSHEAFESYIASGLLKVISATAQENRAQLFQTPHTVSWERVERKLPDIMYDIIDVVEKEKGLYAR
jgi:glucosyl-3-phosphoglycerate synthase